MTNKIESLSTKRAVKSGDCRDWTPLEALKQLITNIEGGELNPDMICICMRQIRKIDGEERERAHYPRIMAGVTQIECIGLLSQHLYEAHYD